MNTNHFTAAVTSPFFILAPQKPPYSELLYMGQVFNHAHAVLRSIALVEMCQARTGKLVAIEAESDLLHSQFAAILYSTQYACLCFRGALEPATRARLLLSCVGRAKAAIHSARRDQSRTCCLCLLLTVHVFIQYHTKAFGQFFPTKTSARIAPLSKLLRRTSDIPG